MSKPWTAPGSHTVQIHVNEPCGYRVIADFFASGAPQSDFRVMISRPGTFKAVSEELDSGRHGPDSAGARILFFDADTVLPQIMDGGVLDPARAGVFFSDVLAQARYWQAGGTIRLYGEMADILSERGQHDAALRLEELANTGFRIDPRLSILCGYSMERFMGEANNGHLRNVCRAHNHVVPAGNFTSAENDVAGPSREVPPVNVSGGRIIYVIDDDKSVRRSLARLLALSGWQVQAFESGESFLAGLDQLSPGAILLDMQLSGMSGIEALRQMRHAGLDWPVIAMSGSQDDDNEAQALRLGGRRYLNKPFEIDTLLDAIAGLQ